MRRWIAIVLVVLTVSVIPALGSATNDEFRTSELERAKVLGIGQADDQPTVSYAQLFSMLDNVVKLIDPTLLPHWQASYPQARNKTDAITRSNAMTAVYYAATQLGDTYCQYNSDWSSVNDRIGDRWDEIVIDEDAFPDWVKPTFIGPEWPSQHIAAYFYAMGRTSKISGAALFDIDESIPSLRTNQLLTYDEALLAALRLFDSGVTATPRIPTEADKDILDKAALRREEIRHSETSIEVTGTAYYVSNSGKDSRNGRAPETAWATLDKVNRAKLKPGDVVFFERGSLWRGQQIKAREGVTYSAYGQGPKPTFYMSPENGAGKDKWKLLKDTTNIWVYHKPLQECGSIVFNDGEKWATKAMHAYTGGYLKGGYNYTGGKRVMIDNHDQPFSLHDSLTKDLMFYSDDSASSFSMDTMLGNKPKKAVKLYLRCDAGNPGEVFGSIEFMSWGALVIPENDTTFDNLCIKYTGSHAIFASDKRITVQNCEFGWIGGGVMCYDADGNPVQYGNAVESDGSYDRFTVQNNYFYQIFDAAMTNQMPWAEQPYLEENISYCGNLVENSRYGVEFFFCVKDVENHLMRNVLVDDNIFLFTGEGVCTNRLLEDSSACIMMWEEPEAPAENFLVSNNIFYLSTSVLLRAGSSKQYLPQLSGNTYVQHTNGLIVRWPNESGIVRSIGNLKEAVNTTLGDATAIVVP